MINYRGHQLVYVDQSAVNELNLQRKYGYAPRGFATTEVRELRRTERWSVLPAYTSIGYLPEPLIVKSSVDGDIFAAWLEDSVLPQMNSYFDDPSAERSILIMDNNSTHRNEVGISYISRISHANML